MHGNLNKNLTGKFLCQLVAAYPNLMWARLIPRWAGLATVTALAGIGLALVTNSMNIYLLGSAGLMLGQSILVGRRFTGR
jgi:hypothetical protein